MIRNCSLSFCWHRFRNLCLIMFQNISPSLEILLLYLYFPYLYPQQQWPVQCHQLFIKWINQICFLTQLFLMTNLYFTSLISINKALLDIWNLMCRFLKILLRIHCLCFIWFFDRVFFYRRHFSRSLYSNWWHIVKQCHNQVPMLGDWTGHIWFFQKLLYRVWLWTSQVMWFS